jgi:hypothetical protein
MMKRLKKNLLIMGALLILFQERKKISGRLGINQ